MTDEQDQQVRNSCLENLQIIQQAEDRGVRFCPSCGSRMHDCCDFHRQFNLLGHRPNSIHTSPKEWICLSCGLREYKEPALRIVCGPAGHL